MIFICSSFGTVSLHCASGSDELTPAAERVRIFSESSTLNAVGSGITSCASGTFSAGGNVRGAVRS